MKAGKRKAKDMFDVGLFQVKKRIVLWSPQEVLPQGPSGEGENEQNMKNESTKKKKKKEKQLIEKNVKNEKNGT